MGLRLRYAGVALISAALCGQAVSAQSLRDWEMLVVDDRIREIVQAKGNATELRSAAQNAGMTLLEEDGKRKVSAGVTTTDEVQRVATPTDL